MFFSYSVPPLCKMYIEPWNTPEVLIAKHMNYSLNKINEFPLICPTLEGMILQTSNRLWVFYEGNPFHSSYGTVVLRTTFENHFNYILTLQWLNHIGFLCTFTSKYTRKHIRLMSFHKTFTIKDTFVSINDSIRLVSKPFAFIPHLKE